MPKKRDVRRPRPESRAGNSAIGALLGVFAAGFPALIYLDGSQAITVTVVAAFLGGLLSFIAGPKIWKGAEMLWQFWL
ncbi:MAG: hypothetical protein AAF196_18635 [Planctomycetota bacterium]